jgi:hypothetical protein
MTHQGATNRRVVVKNVEQHFRLVYLESGSIFESEIPLTGGEAVAHLSLEQMLHELAGWEVERCCWAGLVCTKNDLVRGIHLEPFDPESAALAVGLLAPTSRVDGELEEALLL